jgi:hypothetical protein
MSCGCGTCACKGKAVVEKDEYEGLVEAASPNIEVREAAIQLVAAAQHQGVEGMVKVWVQKLESAVNEQGAAWRKDRP